LIQRLIVCEFDASMTVEKQNAIPAPVVFNNRRLTNYRKVYQSQESEKPPSGVWGVQ